MERKQMKQFLSDAGCSERVSEEILRVWESGNRKEALWMMRRDRCGLLEEMHDRGRKVDRLDLLIRAAEKEIKQEK